MTFVDEGQIPERWFEFAGKAFLNRDVGRLLELAKALAFAGVEEALAGDSIELEKEYVRLFLSPSRAPFPPWQSAHTGDGQLLGEPHLGALTWYRTGGVEPRNNNEPADHIGLLLAFFAHLLDAGAEVGELRNYYRDHLAWMPSFCDAIVGEARHPFYRLLAETTSRAVRQVGLELAA